MLIRFFVPIFALFLAACASEQLNYNTLDIASTTSSLQERQVLANISKFFANEDALPDQVTVSAGSVSTTNSITPTITNTLTNSNVIIGSASAMRTVVSGIGGAGTNQSSQSYVVGITNDGDSLRRLTALYRFATNGDFDALQKDYPKFQVYLPSAQSPSDDPFFEKSPFHALWYRGTRNPRLCRNWVFPSVQNVPSGKTPIDLGHYGAFELYTTQDNRRAHCLSNFVLFILDAAGDTGSPSSLGSPKPSKKDGSDSKATIFNAPSNQPTLDQLAPALR